MSLDTLEQKQVKTVYMPNQYEEKVGLRGLNRQLRSYKALMMPKETIQENTISSAPFTENSEGENQKYHYRVRVKKPHRQTS